MIFIKGLTEITPTKYAIGYIHHLPFDEKHGLRKTAEQLQQEGVLVEAPVQPTLKEGKQATLYYNPVANECFYEVVEIMNEQTELEQLKQRTGDLELMLTEIILGGM